MAYLNISNETLHNVNISSKPTAGYFFMVLSIVMLMINIFLYIVFTKFADKKATIGFFATCFCFGNILCGLSLFISTFNNVSDGILIPYACLLMRWTLSWASLFNLCLTLWICIEQFLTVNNFKAKQVTWVGKWKYLIAFGTGFGIAMYACLMIPLVKHSSLEDCGKSSIYVEYFWVFLVLITIPVFAVLATIIFFYRKTIGILSRMASKNNVVQMRMNTSQLPTCLPVSRANKVNPLVNQDSADIQRQVQIDVVEEDSDETKGTDKHNSAPADIQYQIQIDQAEEDSNETKGTGNSAPADIQCQIQMDQVEEDCSQTVVVDDVNAKRKLPNKCSQTQRIDNRKAVKNDEERVAWFQRAQYTILLLIVQVSFCSIPLSISLFVSYYDFVMIRNIFFGISYLSFFVSPLIYIYRLQELRMAFRRLCG